MKNENEKSLRVCYIRALEKFSKSCIAILKRDDFQWEKFCKKMKKNEEVLRKVNAVFLDSPYTKSLQEYVNLVITKICYNEDSKLLLLKEANSLEKLKNTSSYKKEKHKKRLKYENSDF